MSHTPHRLLVTGGAGFIGANFVHWTLHHRPDVEVVVLDALTYAGNRANLDPVRHHPGLRFVHGDIRDTALAAALLREEALDTLVHFAAESHVDRSIQGPDAFIDTNVNGTHSLLKAARQVWLEEGRTPAHRFHHVSTDEVYGSLGPTDPAFSETTPYAPNSPYAASKAASDHLVRAYHHTYGLAVTTSNCSNNYGPYHFPEKLIPLTLVNLLDGRPVPVYGDGRNIRDWLYVEDHCRGILLVLERGTPGEKYNLGGGNERTNLEVVDTLCALLEEMLPAADNPALAARGISSYRDLRRFVPDRPGHDRRYAIDAAKVRRELGWEPRHSFEEGLRATVAWYLANGAWCNAVLGRGYGRERLGLPATVVGE